MTTSPCRSPTDGWIDVRSADGAVTTSELRAGESYARPAGAEQEVVDAGGAWLAFVEIELEEPMARAAAPVAGPAPTQGGSGHRHGRRG